MNKYKYNFYSLPIYHNLNINLRSSYFILWGLIIVFNFMSCNSLSVPPPSVNPTVIAEIATCTTHTTYNPTVTISGTAVFKKRGWNVTHNGSYVTKFVLGAVQTGSLPIKYAEIRVLNSQSQVVQCGTTNAIGELKALDGVSDLTISSTAGEYKVEVLARAHKLFSPAGKTGSINLQTSVKEDIYSNTVHKIYGTVSSNGFGSNLNIQLTAQANEQISSKIEGAAFNIYNNWVTVFEYLSSQTNTSNLDVSCLSEKLDIYWKEGFNPYQYAYPDADPSSLPQVSFYLKDDTTHELYINGGRLGNISSQDTDHFDDAVILHEMGHHIEAVCGRMDSPGGMHYAQYRIDPRLAWSEGWGNFFAAHIFKNNMSKLNSVISSQIPFGEWTYYNDSIGYDDVGVTTGDSLIVMRMNESGATASYDAVDPVTFPGESHTRETSISRGLFKAVNTCTTRCAGDITFDKYWTALGRTSNGIGSVNSPFRNSAKFLSKLKVANGGTFATSSTTLFRRDEALQLVDDTDYVIAGSHSWPGYAIPLLQSGTCSMVLQPRNVDKTLNKASDQRYSNHFYYFTPSQLSGTSSIKIKISSSNVTCPTEVDLIVFKEGYIYNEDCVYNSNGTCVTSSRTLSNDMASYSRGSFILESGSMTKTIDISSLTAGNYILNIRSYSSSPQSVSGSSACVYTLVNQSGSQLCPTATY